jgi:hypothetical protein
VNDPWEGKPIPLPVKVAGLVFLSMLLVQFIEGETLFKYAYWAIGFLAIVVLINLNVGRIRKESIKPRIRLP